MVLEPTLKPACDVSGRVGKAHRAMACCVVCDMAPNKTARRPQPSPRLVAAPLRERLLQCGGLHPSEQLFALKFGAPLGLPCLDGAIPFPSVCGGGSCGAVAGVVGN
jgi:hypothetical protein